MLQGDKTKKPRKPRTEQVKWKAIAEYLHKLSPETLPLPDELIGVLRGFGMIASHHPDVLLYVKSLDRRP